MAKAASDGILDGTMDVIAACTRMTVQPSQPTSITDITTNTLATETLVGGDFTKANGDTSGRKVTVAAQASITIDTTGTATHVAIDDGVDFTVTTCTSQALTSGGTVTVPAHDYEIADPA